jgi:hypothetical protein
MCTYTVKFERRNTPTNQINLVLGLVYCVQRHFQQYFSYIVAVSFIDGGNPEKTTDLSLTLALT